MILPKHVPSQSHKVFSGIIYDVYHWEQEMFDGSVQTFEKLSRPDTACVIAVTKDKKIVLTHQKQPHSDLFYSVPGGRVDANEEPLEAAKRELREETGYGEGMWKLYSEVTPHEKIAWTLYTFVATDVEPCGETHHEAGENIQVLLVSFDEFLDILTDESCRDTHLALHVLRLQKSAQKLNSFRNLLGV